MNSCLYEGTVRHRRYAPVEHSFRYALFQVYLDLDELPDVFRGRWLWSTRRPTIAWLRRKDHLGDPRIPLKQAVCDLVEDRLGFRPEGPVRLLTHLRYFGYCMNPVSFFYCYSRGAERLEAVVAEINNTPWKERFCYVLDMRNKAGDGDAVAEVHRFQKEFHVSPFMDMNLEYRWGFGEPGERLFVHMENRFGEGRMFDADLLLHRKPITTFSLMRVLVAYPLMTLKVIAAIYWQALRLRLKGAPFYEHPKHKRSSETM